MIQIDEKHEAVLLPIDGTMVPFHVSFIQTVDYHHNADGNGIIRIMFKAPNASNHFSYLKEASFHCKEEARKTELEQSIKQLQKQFLVREFARAERESLVTRKKLKCANRSNLIQLSELWVRPPFTGQKTKRKVPGILEAHAKKFRYSTRRNQHVDIMFANIKHAFFQPAEDEATTILRFHLYNHIMVGKKKTKYVQFFKEVMEMVQIVSGGGQNRSSAYDSLKIEDEQRVRDNTNRINEEFLRFVNQANDGLFRGLDLQFDQPLRELGFVGVPNKSFVCVIPTSACLVELIETPFFVVTLSEIEIVNLERVGLGLKNFDMTIVFKDFKRDVTRIDSIPSTSLDDIKQWLNTMDIKYYESNLNLNWRKIPKTITYDPASFTEGGGWEFLNLEATDSESENSDEGDKRQVPSDVEPKSHAEDDDNEDNISDSESLVKSGDDEEWQTWYELEMQVRDEDTEKGDDESGSEREREGRKMKGFGSGKSGGSTSSSSMPKRSKLR